jgi:hypothetical protein
LKWLQEQRCSKTILEQFLRTSFLPILAYLADNIVNFLIIHCYNIILVHGLQYSEHRKPPIFISISGNFWRNGQKFSWFPPILGKKLAIFFKKRNDAMIRLKPYITSVLRSLTPLPNRVTRLGEFLLTVDIFLKNYRSGPNFSAYFVEVYITYKFWKRGWALYWAIFFTNSSGHPAPKDDKL